MEREEIHDIYSAKGFDGDLLDRVVDNITANRERQVLEMIESSTCS